MKTVNPEDERNILRKRWHSIRNERLNLKKKLSDSGETVCEIRHDRDYRRLKKEQKLLSKLIRHIERKLTAGKHEKQK
jgi:hypothetical protein